MVTIYYGSMPAASSLARSLRVARSTRARARHGYCPVWEASPHPGYGGHHGNQLVRDLPAGPPWACSTPLQRRAQATRTRGTGLGGAVGHRGATRRGGKLCERRGGRRAHHPPISDNGAFHAWAARTAPRASRAIHSPSHRRALFRLSCVMPAVSGVSHWETLRGDLY